MQIFCSPYFRRLNQTFDKHFSLECYNVALDEMKRNERFEAKRVVIVFDCFWL